MKTQEIKKKRPSSIRLDTDEEEMLKKLVDKYGFTRTSALKAGLHMLYSKLIKNKTE